MAMHTTKSIEAASGNGAASDDEMVIPARAADAGRSPRIRWLVYGIVALGALTSAIFGVLSLVAPNTFLSIVGVQHEPLTAGIQVFAAYTGARELAIAALLIILLFMRSTRALPALMLVTSLANAVDGFHALATQRWPQVPGAFVFAILYAVAAMWLFNQPARSGATSRNASPRRE